MTDEWLPLDWINHSSLSLLFSGFGNQGFLPQDIIYE